MKTKKAIPVDLMFAVMKEFNIEDRRKARDIINFITNNKTLMGMEPGRANMELPESAVPDNVLLPSC